MQPYLDALGKDASSVDPALLQALRGAHAHAADAVADVEARVAALLPPRYRDAVRRRPSGQGELTEPLPYPVPRNLTTSRRTPGRRRSSGPG